MSTDDDPGPDTPQRHRHSLPHGAFGGDRFGLAAERFARLFGTPGFLLAQTRQADRDRAQAELDEHHRDALAERYNQLLEPQAHPPRGRADRAAGATLTRAHARLPKAHRGLIQAT